MHKLTPGRIYYLFCISIFVIAMLAYVAILIYRAIT